MYNLNLGTSEIVDLQISLQEKIEKLIEDQKVYVTMSEEELNEEVFYYSGIGPKTKRELKERIEKRIVDHKALLHKISTLKWE